MALTGERRAATYLIFGFNWCFEMLKGGMATFENVYLVTVEGWLPSWAGGMRTIHEVMMMVYEIPNGDLLDKTSSKRALVAGCLLAATGAAAIYLIPGATDPSGGGFAAMVVRNLVSGYTGTILLDGSASLTLGVVGPSRFDVTESRNQITRRTGKTVAFVAAGAISYATYPDVYGVFFIPVAYGLVAFCLVLAIRPSAVDADVARGAAPAPPLGRGVSFARELRRTGTLRGFVPAKAALYMSVLQDPNMAVFCLCSFLFNTANSGVMPLLAQVVAKEAGREGLAWACALVIVNEATAAVVTFAAQKFMARVDYKAAVLVGFAALPVRCLAIAALHEGGAGRGFLALTPVLDAVGVGIHSLSAAVVTRALTAGTGRFAFALAVVHTTKSVGQAISQLMAGILAEQGAAGLKPYTLAFLVLGAIAVLPVLLAAFFFKSPPRCADGDEARQEGGAEASAEPPATDQSEATVVGAPS